MTTLKKTAIAVTTVLLTLGIITAAHAAGSECQIIYGGGEVCNRQIQFAINKLVEVPGKGGGNFVDNLNVNDPKFSAGQTIPFKIVITNTGSNKIDHIRVTDSLPQYLTYVSGDGSWDANARKITFDVNNLDASRAQQFVINTKVVDNNQLPQDQGTICVVNQVNAFEDSGFTASDSSQVCISRQVLGVNPTPQVFTTVPVKTIPNTGPEMLPLLGLVPLGLTGFILRKKIKLN